MPAVATMPTLADAIFEAIRKGQLLGSGSLSSLEECYTDRELRDEIGKNLADGTFVSVQGAIDYYTYLESVFWERQGSYATRWHEADAERKKAGREWFRS